MIWVSLESPRPKKGVKSFKRWLFQNIFQNTQQSSFNYYNHHVSKNHFIRFINFHHFEEFRPSFVLGPFGPSHNRCRNTKLNSRSNSSLRFHEPFVRHLAIRESKYFMNRSPWFIGDKKWCTHKRPKATAPKTATFTQMICNLFQNATTAEHSFAIRTRTGQTRTKTSFPFSRSVSRWTRYTRFKNFNF